MSSYKKYQPSVNNVNATPATTGSVSTAPKPDMLGNIVKWIPLLCAGAAVGVSILAIKEIRNINKELINLKKESLNNTKHSSESVDPMLLKKIELMDEQIRKISKYLGTLQNENNNKRQESPVIKRVINEEPELKNTNRPVKQEFINLETPVNQTVKIPVVHPVQPVNNSEVLKEPVQEQQVDDEEYEYEEVTDDEEE